MQEVWKDIDGYNGRYQISNLGRVKSFYLKSERICIGGITKSKKGYRAFYLPFNGIYKCTHIHRLVAIAFIPNPENKPQINHIDGNRLNNYVNNLEWCTGSENTIHAFKLGLRPTWPGEKCHLSKLTTVQVLDIKHRLKRGELKKNIAAIYSVTTAAISMIHRNKNWKHVQLD